MKCSRQQWSLNSTQARSATHPSLAQDLPRRTRSCIQPGLDSGQSDYSLESTRVVLSNGENRLSLSLFFIVFVLEPFLLLLGTETVLGADGAQIYF